MRRLGSKISIVTVILIAVAIVGVRDLLKSKDQIFGGMPTGNVSNPSVADYFRQYSAGGQLKADITAFMDSGIKGSINDKAEKTSLDRYWIIFESRFQDCMKAKVNDQVASHSSISSAKATTEIIESIMKENMNACLLETKANIQKEMNTVHDGWDSEIK